MNDTDTVTESVSLSDSDNASGTTHTVTVYKHSVSDSHPQSQSQTSSVQWSETEWSAVSTVVCVQALIEADTGGQQVTCLSLYHHHVNDECREY